MHREDERHAQDVGDADQVLLRVEPHALVDIRIDDDRRARLPHAPGDALTRSDADADGRLQAAGCVADDDFAARWIEESDETVRGFEELGGAVDDALQQLRRVEALHQRRRHLVEHGQRAIFAAHVLWWLGHRK